MPRWHGFASGVFRLGTLIIFALSARCKFMRSTGAAAAFPLPRKGPVAAPSPIRPSRRELIHHFDDGLGAHRAKRSAGRAHHAVPDRPVESAMAIFRALERPHDIG